jgi:hypothetical protein
MSRKLFAVPTALILSALCLPLAAQQADAEVEPQAAPAASAAQQSPPPQAGQKRAAPKPRPPEDPAKLEQDSRAAYADGDYMKFYIANLKLHKQMPYVPQYMINLVRACALLEKYNTAYHYMFRLQQQGLSFDFNSTDDTESIRGTQAYDYINNLLIEAGQPAGEGSVLATLPGAPQDYASIAWDPSRERLLLGTLREGKLLAVGAEGNSELLLQASDTNQLWSITGIAVDADNNRLWLSTTASPAFDRLSPADRNRAALVELELDELKELNRYYAPVDALHHELGAVSKATDGNVYVIDTVSPIVYRKAPEADRLEPFVASNQLVGFTDLAVTPDNSRLFVADPVMGVFLVDPREKSAAMLSADDNLNLGGIDGIDFADGKLFIVQGGLSPQRLMRIELDPAGLAAATVSPMAIALEPFNWPRLAAHGAGALYYIANQGEGSEEDGAIVMRTPLDAGSEIQPPDIDDLKRALQAQPQ